MGATILAACKPCRWFCRTPRVDRAGRVRRSPRGRQPRCRRCSIRLDRRVFDGNGIAPGAPCRLRSVFHRHGRSPRAASCHRGRRPQRSRCAALFVRSRESRPQSQVRRWISSSACWSVSCCSRVSVRQVSKLSATTMPARSSFRRRPRSGHGSVSTSAACRQCAWYGATTGSSRLLRRDRGRDSIGRPRGPSPVER